MMLWSLHTENTRLNQQWDYFRCVTTYLISIPQRQFCRIYGVDSRLEVIWGRWFWHQSKAHISIPIGPQ